MKKRHLAYDELCLKYIRCSRNACDANGSAAGVNWGACEVGGTRGADSCEQGTAAVNCKNMGLEANDPNVVDQSCNDNEQSAGSEDAACNGGNQPGTGKTYCNAGTDATLAL